MKNLVPVAGCVLEQVCESKSRFIKRQGWMGKQAYVAEGDLSALEATYQRKKRRTSRIQFWLTADRMHVEEGGMGD